MVAESRGRTASSQRKGYLRDGRWSGAVHWRPPPWMGWSCQRDRARRVPLLSSRIHGPRYILTGPTHGKQLVEVAKAAETGVLPPIDLILPFEVESMRRALGRAAAHQNDGRIVIDVNDTK